jgi:hypothetical protein
MRPLRVVIAFLVLSLGAWSPPPARAVPHPLAPDCRIFPDHNVWHSKVTGLPVHRRSKQWIRAMGGKQQRLHPDFGPSDDPDHPHGIAYNVVDGTYSKQAVSFSYSDESDPGPSRSAQTPTSSTAATGTRW